MTGLSLQQVPPQPAPGDVPKRPPPPSPGPARPPLPVQDPDVEPGQEPPPVQDPDVVDPTPTPQSPPLIARPARPGTA